VASSETLAAGGVPSPFGAGPLRPARGVSPRGGRHHAIGDGRRLRLQADGLAGAASGTSHCRHLPSTVRHVRAGRLRDLACTAHRAAAAGGAGNPGLADAGRLRGTDPARESVTASTLRRVFCRLPAYCAPEELSWLVASEDVLRAKIARSLRRIGIEGGANIFLALRYFDRTAGGNACAVMHRSRKVAFRRAELRRFIGLGIMGGAMAGNLVRERIAGITRSSKASS
jgi:hypothetical protein